MTIALPSPSSTNLAAARATLSSSPSANTTCRWRAAARERRSAMNPTLRRRLGLVLLAESGSDGRMNEAIELSAVLRHFPHHARADVGRLDRRNHENRFQPGGHVTV